MRRALAVFGLLLAAGQAHGQESWVGKVIVIKTPGVRLTPRDANAPMISAVLDGLSYFALAEDNGQVEVRTRRGIAGWFDKSNAILLEDAADYFTTVLRGNPKDADAFFRRGGCSQLRGKLDSAIKDYGEAITLAPKNAGFRVNRGHAWYQKGNLDKAMADYQAAIVIQPKASDLWCTLGFGFVEQGNPDKALEAFSEALKHNPKYVRAYMGRAGVYSARKDNDRALAEFNAILRINPNDPLNLSNRAKIYIDKKDYDKAIDDYTQAVRLAPRFDHAFFGRAIAWLHKREYAKVLADCDETISLNPKHALAYNQRAWILATCPDAKVRDGRRAVESAKQAVALANEPGMMDTLAASYAEAGDFAQAVSWEERALKDADFSRTDAPGARRRLGLYRRKMAFRDGG